VRTKVKRVSCKWVKNNLSGYLDAEISSEQSLLIKNHLGICQTCQGFLSGLKGLKENLNSLSEIPSLEPPVFISEEIKKRLPKYEFGIFTDPVMRNLIFGGLGVIIFFITWFKFIPVSTPILPQITQIEAGRILQIKDNLFFFKERSQFQTQSLSPPTFKLFKGEVLVSVIKPSALIIYTPHLKIQVEGTRFKVLVGKETEVEVLEGRVRVGDFVIKEFEKIVCAKEVISQPLLTKEIERLKEEFSKAGLYGEKKPKTKKKIIFWREVR